MQYKTGAAARVFIQQKTYRVKLQFNTAYFEGYIAKINQYR